MARAVPSAKNFQCAIITSTVRRSNLTSTTMNWPVFILCLAFGSYTTAFTVTSPANGTIWTTSGESFVNVPPGGDIDVYMYRTEYDLMECSAWRPTVFQHPARTEQLDSFHANPALITCRRHASDGNRHHKSLFVAHAVLVCAFVGFEKRGSDKTDF
jgi:hypothetical protein